MMKANEYINCSKANQGSNKNYSNSIYPSTDDIRDTKNHVTELLSFFVNEIVRSPVKQNPFSQIIFSATRPRSLMAFQFALHVFFIRKPFFLPDP